MKWAAQSNFRNATREDVTIKIGLPDGCFIVGHVTGTPENYSEVMTYADLPQALKDQIWQKASADAIEGGRQQWKMMNTPQPTTPVIPTNPSRPK
jgi:hypothetical protein